MKKRFVIHRWLVMLAILLVAGLAFGAVKRDGTWPETDKTITLDMSSVSRSEAVRKVAEAAGWTSCPRDCPRANRPPRKKPACVAGARSRFVRCQVCRATRRGSHPDCSRRECPAGHASGAGACPRCFAGPARVIGTDEKKETQGSRRFEQESHGLRRQRSCRTDGGRGRHRRVRR